VGLNGTLVVGEAASKLAGYTKMRVSELWSSIQPVVIGKKEANREGREERQEL
jgi:hypothetical protein